MYYLNYPPYPQLLISEKEMYTHVIEAKDKQVLHKSSIFHESNEKRDL